VYSDDEEEVQNLNPAESFRRAKVDHYIDRARECVHMGRYLSAKKTLELVSALEKESPAAEEIRGLLEDAMTQIQQRSSNGHAHKDGDESAGRPRRHELVLVVDQDEELLTSLAATLRRYGFLAIGAASYEEAIETFAFAKPDVIISEVNFETGPRGFDLYLWLKTNSGTDTIPFLFLATRIDRETLIAGKRFGVDDLILKPVDDDVVIASVINCLARKKATRTPA
jgi:CheY-like chemotaxis protein